MARQSIARLNGMMTIVTRDYSPYIGKELFGALRVQLLRAMSRAETILAGSGITVIARVWDAPRALNIAIRCANSSVANIRCVSRPTAQDYCALQTMTSEGDFDRAILVYSECEKSILSDEIETWHIDDIEHLVARLAAGAAP